MKAWLKYFCRLIVSGAAIYIVYRKIDVNAVADFAVKASVPLLFASILLYNCSQVTSSRRLFGFLKAIDPEINAIWNLRLYYRGMFYNLFLPGSVTGDAYKIIMLKRRSHAPYKLFITAVMLDRVTGLILIIVLISLLFLLKAAGKSFAVSWYFISATTIFVPLFLWLAVNRFFHRFRLPFVSGCLLSLVVQLLQLTSLVCILHALGVEPGQYLTYALMFYVSSLVSVIPFTLGGLGSRELVFMMGADWLSLDSTVAVSAAFVFFLVGALSSLAGAWLPVEISAQNCSRPPINA